MVSPKWGGTGEFLEQFVLFTCTVTPLTPIPIPLGKTILVTFLLVPLLPLSTTVFPQQPACLNLGSGWRWLRLAKRHPMKWTESRRGGGRMWKELPDCIKDILCVPLLEGKLWRSQATSSAAVGVMQWGRTQGESGRPQRVVDTQYGQAVVRQKQSLPPAQGTEHAASRALFI